MKKINLKQKFFQKYFATLSKPINSDASEFLQTKTENSQCKSNENIKENACFKVKKQELSDSFIHGLIKGQETNVLKF